MAAVIVLPAAAHSLPGARRSEEVYFFAQLASFDASASSRSSRGEVQTCVTAEIELAEPITAHAPLRNRRHCKDCIVVAERGECRFTEKYERLAEAGAAAVVIANQSQSHPDTVFAMSGVLKKMKHLPLCVMLSFNDYRALRASGVTRATVRPMVEDDLPHLKRSSLAAAVRACVTQRTDALLLATIEEAKRRGIALSEVLDEQEEERGCTAVHLAVEQGNRSALEILLRHRAHPDLLRNDGYSPLHIAVEKQAHDMIALLLHHGAYVDRQHTLGWTSLHFAAKTGAEESVTALLTVGANPNAVAKDGSTPLHVACMFGQAGVVRVLLANQARCEVVNAKLKTPQEVAQRLGHAACAQLIENHVKQLHRSLQGDKLEPDLLRHDEISFGYHLAADHEVLTYLDSSPPWILEGFEEAVAALPRFSACCMTDGNEGKCLVPVWVAEALEQDGVVENGRLNDTGPNRAKLVEAYKQAAHELANHTEGFLPEMRAIFFPAQVRAAMWLAALDPVNVSLVQDGLDDELLEEALDYVATELEQIQLSGLIRAADMSKVQSLMGSPASRMSDKSVACRSSSRYSRSTRTLSTEARTASMKLDLHRHSCRTSDGGGRMAALLQAFLVLSEQHEYKSGLDLLLLPILEAISDDPTALRVLLCVLEQHHNGYFSQGSMDSLKPMLQNIMGALKFWDPRLWMVLMAQDIVPQAFAVSWLVSLFANTFRVDDCLQVWDHILPFGDRFVSMLGASMLLEIRKELCACQDNTDMLMLIASVTTGDLYVNVQKVCQRAVWMFLSTPASLFSFDLEPNVGKPVSMRLPRAVFPRTLDEGRLASQGIPVVTLDHLRSAVLPLTIVDVRDTQHDDFALLKARAAAVLPGITALHCPLYKLRGIMDYCHSLSLEAIANEPAMLHPHALLTPHRYEQVVIASDNSEDATKFATVLVLCAFPRVTILDHRVLA